MPTKKAQKRQLAADWQKVLAQHSKPLERGAKAKNTPSKTKIAKSKLPALLVPPGRSVRDLPSLDTGAASTAAQATPQYTGNKMLGVVVMHKSCLQPVFSDEAAQDAAKMRR